jgi:hypothetical protein
MTTSTAIATALRDHFVDPKDPTSGIVLTEVTAPGSTRRIDVLAMSLWPSRGYGIDAVEIKVDRRDYLREIETPAKADPWWRNSHRFWIAAPSTAVADPALLPPGWGLLIPGTGRRFKTVVKADERKPELGMALFAAILARQVNASHEQTRIRLDRQRDDLDTKRRDAERALREQYAAGSDPAVRKALDMVRTVEKASGLRIEEWGFGDHVTAEEFGRAMRQVVQQDRASEESDRAVATLVDDLRRRAVQINRLADQLTQPSVTP